MKRYFLIFIAVIAVLFLMTLEIAYGKTTVGPYPFSESIDWEKKETRQHYEIFLQMEGMRYVALPIFWHDGETRLAEEENCVFFKKDGTLVGYGITYTKLKRFAYAKKKDDLRKILVQKVDIIYDLAGRYIFLVSYSFELGVVDRFVAKYIMRRETEAKRQNFKDGVLDEGYELNEESKNLVERLLAIPQECKKMFDETSPKRK
ncbi:MAG: hypothetical protein WAP51_00970 [Candidatus Sungiibacteriota bacterium]